jgi:Na+/H+-dicarboxylate symporter
METNYTVLIVLTCAFFYFIVLIIIYTVCQQFYPPRQIERERHEASVSYVRDLSLIE